MRPIRAISLLLLLAGCSRDLEVPGSPGAGLALSVDPAAATVAPRGELEFTVSGGTPPYALELELNSTNERGAASASLHGVAITYKAGAQGSVFDELLVGDAGGNQLVVRITVGGALQASPPYALVNANGFIHLTGVGGQPPYTFTFDRARDVEDGAGSLLFYQDDLTRGGEEVAGREAAALLAGPGYGKNFVRLADAWGSEAEAEITIGTALSIIPRVASLSPGGTIAFQALGGDPTYEWAIGQGEPPVPAQLPEVTLEDGVLRVGEAFVPPPDFDGTFSVILSDGVPGVFTSATVTLVIPPELLAPVLPRIVAPGTALELRASGGVAPYSYSYATLGNLSGGSLTPEGAYRAGPNPRQTDLLSVRDAAGTTAGFPIVVGLTTLPIAEYQEVMTPVLSGGWQPFPFVSGHLFVPGGHVRMGSDGRLRALPALGGRIQDVVDVNDDALPDLLVSAGDSGESVAPVLAYSATLNGDVAFVGGGQLAAAAAVLPGPDGLSQVLFAETSGRNQASCGLGLVAWTDYLTGAPPTCLTPSPGPRFLVRTEIGGPSDRQLLTDSYVAAVSWAGVEVYSVELFTPSVTLKHTCTVDPGSPPLDWSPPIAADVDGDQHPDLAYVLVGPGAPGGAPDVRLGVCLWSTAGAAPLLELPLAGVSPSAQLFPGPKQGGVETLLLDVHSPGGGRGEPARRFRYEAGALVEAEPLDGVRSVVGTGDADGDLVGDVLGATEFGDYELHFGDAAGQLDSGTRFRAGPTGRYQFLTGRVDADGCDDLVAVTTGNSRLLAGTGGCGELGRPPGLATLTDTGELGILLVADLADVTGDGRPDLIALSSSGEPAIVPFDGATGLFGAPLQVPVTLDPASGAPVGAYLKEPDPGGAIQPADILFPIHDGPQGAIGAIEFQLVGPGLTRLGERVRRELSPPVQTMQPYFADVTGDGIVDLVAAPECPPGVPCGVGELRFFEGTGRGLDFDLVERVPALTSFAPGDGYAVDPAGHRVLKISTHAASRALAPCELGDCALVVDAWTVGAGVTTHTQGALRILDFLPDTAAGSLSATDLDGDGLPELVVHGTLDPTGGPDNVIAVAPIPLALVDPAPVMGATVLGPTGNEAATAFLELTGDRAPELVTLVRPVTAQSSAPPDLQLWHLVGDHFEPGVQ